MFFFSTNYNLRVDNNNNSNNNNNMYLNEELLFWKVFRNVVLFRKIMSFMDTHLSPQYDSILSVNEMIKSKQYSILRDKVIRNQYLTFNEHMEHSKTKDSDKLIQIFKIFKNDNDQDRLFYQHLFKNYSEYSLNFNNFQVLNYKVTLKENGREEFVNDIINSRCLPALQVLIKHYQYKPTNCNLQYAINQGALKFIKLLLSPKFNLQVTLPIPDDKYKNIKSLNYLINENHINISEIPIGIIRFKSVEYNLQLKSLLIICKLILNVYTTTTTTIQSISIEEIESFLKCFSKQELKSQLSDKSNQVEVKKQIIIKLFNLYYSFINVDEKHDEFYQIYFNNYHEYQYEIKDKVISYLSSFQFANFNILKKLSFVNYSNKILKKFKGRQIYFLFSHCSMDGKEETKERKINFINQIVNSLKSNDKNDWYISPILFFYLIIYNDDLQLIQHASNELGNLITVNFDKKLYITQYINSKNVLNWLFYNHFNHFNNTPSIWYFKNVELLIHYESLYYNYQDGKKEESIKLYPISYYLPICEITVLNHIFKSGQSVFKITDDINRYSSIISCCTTNGLTLNDKFELSKLFYKNYKCNQINYLKDFIECDEVSSIKHHYLIKFLDWLYVNYNNEFITNFKLYTTNLTTQNTILFTIGRINETSLDYNLISIYKSNTVINIKFIDFFLCKDRKFQETQYYNLLEYLIFKGDLKLIKHIQINHNWLLSNLVTDDIDNYVFSSISTCNLEISKYLFKLFSITKLNLKNGNNISMVYFRNLQN